MLVQFCVVTWSPSVHSGMSRNKSLRLVRDVEGFCKEGQLGRALDSLFRMDEQGDVPSVNAYRRVLKECTRRKALAQAKRVHSHLAQRGLEASRSLGEYVVNALVKCGGLEDGLQLFDRLPRRTALSWTAVIFGHTQAGQHQEALRMYRRMRIEGSLPDKYTFASLLRSCGCLLDLEEGKRIHAETVGYLWDSDLVVGTCLVDMYSKCGSIGDARDVFDKLSQRDVVAWTTMIAAYAHHGQPQKALQVYEQMRIAGASPDDRTFVTALQACAMLAEKEDDVVVGRGWIKPDSLLLGKTLHADAQRKCYDTDVFVGSTLVNMYGKCGSIADAENVFNQMPNRNLVAWTAMLAAHLQHDDADQAFDLYEAMQMAGISPDGRAIVSTIQACTILSEREDDVVVTGQFLKVECLQKGKSIHAYARSKHNDIPVFLGNTLISFYGKCGSLVDAQKAFSELCERDAVSWTAMLAVYAQLGLADKALQMYTDMQLIDQLSPEVRTYVSTLQACGTIAERDDDVDINGHFAKAKCLMKGKAIHAEAWKKSCDLDVFFGSSLISLYGKCGSIVDAQCVFHRLPQQHVVLCNAMLAAYVSHNDAENVLQLYEKMLEQNCSVDERTYVSVLQACGMQAEMEDDVALDGQYIKVRSLNLVKSIHAHASREGHRPEHFVSNVLITAYGKCGNVVDAQFVFDRISKRSVVSWNALVTAHLQQDEGVKAFQVYRQMQEEGFSPNEVTVVCALQACSNIGSLGLCRQIHSDTVNSDDTLSPLLASTLIHVYGRCASMVDALSLFDTLHTRDVVAWTALISGYAREGDCMACIKCYEDMQVARVKPDGVTFLALLAACSHAGFVDKGVTYFESMSAEHSITPNIQHYAAMVDLLGRAGYFKIVEDLILRMPMCPDMAIWASLLGACQKHGKVGIGKWAFDHAVRLDSKHAASYVLMSNIYTDAGLWDNADEVKQLSQNVVARKRPGQSWIEHEQNVHTFVVDDHNHSQQRELYSLLGEIRTSLEVGWQ